MTRTAPRRRRMGRVKARAFTVGAIADRGRPEIVA